MNNEKKIVRIATRGSRLALAQTRLAEEKIIELGYETQLVIVNTKGDKNRKDSLHKIGGDGLFIRELERILLEGKADIAVHSAKDMPAVLTKGLCVSAVLEPESPNDVLLMKKGTGPKAGTIIGTGSARRQLMIKNLYPDVVIKDIRGNIDTRIDKLRRGEYDGIVLAAAGLNRLRDDISEFDKIEFGIADMLPSPGQGIIAVESDEGDEELNLLLREKICHKPTMYRLQAERELLRLLEAGCNTPLGVYAEIEYEKLTLHAQLDSKRIEVNGAVADILSICKEAAGKLREKAK